MIKIVCVNIAFREESFYKRWRMLANDYNFDVTLIGPKYYEYKFAGPTMVFKPEEVSEHNFRVRHINMTPKKYLRDDWFDYKYIKILKETKPDFIYLIGYETQNVVFLSQYYRKMFSSKTVIALFSMRGTPMPLFGLEFRNRWKMAKKVFKFINCHYPHGREIFREQGKFDKNIYLQTQIGVNKDIFRPDAERRRQIRQQYNIADTDFVFSAAIRISPAKGVYEIIDACRTLKGNFKFFLMGNGSDFDKVKDLIPEYGLENKIILTGRVESGEPVAAYMNASDCFVHIPKTTPHWVDTFPLAVVQAMASGLPVIGSTNGAVPYQLGPDGVIIPESDSVTLAEKMEFFINNREIAKQTGERLLERVLHTFEIRHLNKCLAQTINAYVSGNEENAIDDQANAINIL